MFRIDTGTTSQPPMAKSALCDDTQSIQFTNWTRADRAKRQTIEALQSCETPEELQDYIKSESLLIDALFLFDPVMAEDIAEAEQEHRAHLVNGAASLLRNCAEPRTAVSVPQEKERKPMFHIDTGNSDGPRGPFLSYKQRAGQGMGDGSWYLREKDGEEWSYTDMTDTMRNGVVADIFATHDGQLGGTLQLGYIKFNEGSAPDRSWWASPLKSEPRPDDSKTPSGGFAWQNIMSFRVAIGGGRDAQLDVSGWGGYKGMTALIGLLNQGFADNIGKCPLIQYTGFRVEGSGAKRLHVPEWTVAQWVDRPACLKPEAPQIAPAPAETAPAPAPNPAPKPVPVSNGAVSSAGAF